MKRLLGRTCVRRRTSVPQPLGPGERGSDGAPGHVLCGHVDIETGVDGRFVTTTCRACSAVLQIEFNPPDEPCLRARIDRIDDTESPERAPRVRPGSRAICGSDAHDFNFAVVRNGT
jgi:hypothetical protein